MNLEIFVTECFQKHLAADLLEVTVSPLAGTMHVRVIVGGHLPEAKAVAEGLMAELAELDRSVHVSVELGNPRSGSLAVLRGLEGHGTV
jgi:hypothetical protein